MKRALVILLVTACTPGAVGPSYRGEPLFTVKGQLVTSGPAPTAPIRLAVAWYPSEDAPTAPRALVTQDVEYQGSFPLNYTFSFFEPPPDGVLAETVTNGVTARTAFGVLMAYEDTNGNGRLDSIPKGGSAVDRVLGTSLGDTYNGKPASPPLWVAYVEGNPGGPWSSFSPGYNLYLARSVAPPSTNVTVRLDGTNELALFVCEEFVSSSSYGYDLPCNITPTGGVRVIGNLYRQDGIGGASLRVTDGFRPLTSARVLVNGAPVSYDAASGLFYAHGSVPIVTPGKNVLSVSSGTSALEFTLEAPAEVSIEQPALRVLMSGSTTLAWQRTDRAAFFTAQMRPARMLGDELPGVTVANTGAERYSHRFTGFRRVELHAATVSAFAQNYVAYGSGGSMVNVATARTAYVDVLPDDIGGWLEGTALRSSYRGQAYSAVYVQAFDGTTLVSNALVTANGDALTWDAPTQQYAGNAEFFPDDTVTLGVTVPGKPRKTSTVTMPSDFTPTTPPRSHPANQPLRLTWPTVQGATDYRVLVSNSTGRQLHFSNVLETSVDVPALGVAQDVLVTIAAAKFDPAGHLVGLVQYVYDVQLTP